MTKQKIDPERARVLRDNAFRSANRHEPARVAAVRSKRGDAAANRMIAAIALDETRAKGVKA